MISLCTGFCRSRERYGIQPLLPVAKVGRCTRMSTVWEKICLLLQQKLDPGHYKVWIMPLTGQCEVGRLTIFALNEFVASFIRTRFLGMIQEAALEAAGEPLEVLVTVGLPQQPVGVAALAQSPALVPTPLEKAPAPESCAPPQPEAVTQYYLPLSLAGGTEASVQARSWRHSFDSFVVGPSNELAFAASRSICRDANSSDVLFLSSSSGLGKTHLLQAVGQGLFQASNRRSPKVEYLTAEEFVSRFFMAIKTGDTDRFKARYREVDVLLLEDVHFIQGKEKMQDELLATIKALQDRGSKVVFSSSFVPRDLRQMSEALLSRLGSGFLATIERPNRDMRKRILQEKAKLHQVLLPEDVTELLAEHIVNDVRQIESCLQNLVLKAKLLNCGITMQLAWETLEHYTNREKCLDLEGIISYVCQGYGIAPEQMLSKSRKRELVTARNTVFYLARKHTEMSLSDIGGRFNRSHSTVIKGITSLEREISLETSLGRQMAGTISIIERNGGIISLSS